MYRSFKLMAGLVVSVTLAACSGSPSGSDIRHAMVQQVKSLAAENPFAGSMGISIDDVERLGCQEVGRETYECDVRIKGSSVITGKTVRATRVRLAKSSDGWVIVQ